MADFSSSLSVDATRMAGSTLPDALLNAFTAVRHLHPKQLVLLNYLNSRRDPTATNQTVPLSYSHLHHATGITIEHIRRNGLHRLFASGLLSVVQQGLGGTIYRLHYDAAVIAQVIQKVGVPATPTVPQHAEVMQLKEELAELEARLETMKKVQEHRRRLQREEFEAQLSLDQRQWFVVEAKRRVDQQDGIRFIRDRFPQYEAERLKLIDEWIARQAYGQPIPAASTSALEEAPMSTTPP